MLGRYCCCHLSCLPSTHLVAVISSSASADLFQVNSIPTGDLSIWANVEFAIASISPLFRYRRGVATSCIVIGEAIKYGCYSRSSILKQ